MFTLEWNSLSAVVRAAHLAVPIAGALTFTPTDIANRRVKQMADLQFNCAPVIVDHDVIGLFGPLADLIITDEASVGELMRPLSSQLIVSSTTTLTSLIRRLENESFLFVVDDSGIMGFVTVADLGSVHVRTHFYMRLAHLESELSESLRRLYREQAGALAHLKPKRRQRQAEVAKALRYQDKFIDDIACLSLEDLVTIAGRDCEFRRIIESAGVGWNKTLHGLADFRDEVMHPTRPLLLSASSSPAKLAQRERSLEALIHAVDALNQRQIESQ